MDRRQFLGSVITVPPLMSLLDLKPTKAGENNLCEMCRHPECGCPMGVDSRYIFPLTDLPFPKNFGSISGPKIKPSPKVTRSAKVLTGWKSSFEQVFLPIPNIIDADDTWPLNIYVYVLDMNGFILSKVKQVDLIKRQIKFVETRHIPTPQYPIYMCDEAKPFGQPIDYVPELISDDLNGKYAVYVSVRNFKKTYRIA